MRNSSDQKIYNYFQILKDEIDVVARKKAVEEILKIEESVFLDFVSRALNSEKDVEILAYTADMIMKRKIEGRASLILPLLKSSNPVLRGHICGLLGNSGDKIAVNMLIDRLKSDESVDVRLTAAHALGKLGDKKAIPDLIEAREHDFSKDMDGWSVSHQAKMAIEEIEQNS